MDPTNVGDGLLIDDKISHDRLNKVMEENMIKVDIADAITHSADISRVTALKAVDVILEEMTGALVKGSRIEIRGFGVFEKVVRKKSTGRDILKGKIIEVPAANTIKYKPGSNIVIATKK